MQLSELLTKKELETCKIKAKSIMEELVDLDYSAKEIAGIGTIIKEVSKAALQGIDKKWTLEF